jgi:type 1 glutamine amidotransferase/glucose/arabinose dehydrogenase
VRHLALALIVALVPSAPPDRAKKIVLIAGPLDSHPKDSHEYERNIILLKHCIDASPSFKGARVEVHFGGWPADPAALDDADTIFLTSGGCDHKLEDHPLYVGDHLQVLERQMKRGCGVIFHHWSTFHPAKYHDLITEAVGGYFDYETGPPPRKWFSKIETRDFDTSVGAPDHPIARGVKPFRVKEEFYFNLKFRDDDSRLAPILLCRDGDVRANTVAWAVERKDGGRGFGFTGGHFYANWWLPEFRRLVLNAIAWTAKIDVPAGGVESSLEEPVRALVLTGHNHPAHDWRSTTAALIHVLEQDPRMKVEVTENPEDLATRLDACGLLVLNYCNWDKPGLSEAAKSGFLKHLERGGGLAVIHFANGAWNPTIPAKDSDWPDYRARIIRRVWMHPDSAHDPFGVFSVTVTGAAHEITAGLARFETKDELYFKQVGSLPITPLATAKSKGSGQDEPMAWAYDVEKARVFQTVLGHAAESVRKAGALIRRGSAWAARRAPLGFDPPLDLLEKATFRPGSRWTGQAAPAPQEPPKPKVLPPDPGLEGGKFGHWGKAGEADWADARWNAADVGPFMTSALKVGDETLLRAISIKVGDGGIVFDPDTLSMRAGWTGKFLQFSPARYGLIEKPRIAGDIQWTAPRGPKGRYLGLILRGNRVGISYELPREGFGAVRISEWPGAESYEGVTAFSRTFVVHSGRPGLSMPVVSLPGSTGAIETVEGVSLAVLRAGDQVAAAALLSPRRFAWKVEGGVIAYENGAFNAVSAQEKVLVWAGPSADLSKFAALVKKSPPQPVNVQKEEPENITKGQPPRWPTPIGTKGQVSRDKGPYVVDTLTVPYENPWNALMFLSGVDFFRNGDAAVCTIHGDVWIVRGIDDKLEKLTWKRYATGLYQPLGLRIVDDKIYVLGRDRITRLIDQDGDGEADVYENFCADLPTSAGGHDFITCLETDAQGNFYFVSWKGLFRVSPDGKKTEVVAGGLRNPNGLSIGPDGTITVAPQEGEWTPASAILVARPGGYYGYGGPKVTPDRPLGYDPPLCWIPRGVDNSTGGQTWVTGDRWGPLEGQLLSFSFGQSSMMLVLREQVDGLWQGGVVPMKVGFASGAHRARFRPQDGQLYVVGTKGWVSNATRDGSLQRVRYTGAKVHLPVELHAVAGGLRLRFLEPLDKEIAQDGDGWSAEQWNYLYSKEYGSKEWSALQSNVEGHDALDIKAIHLSDDGRTVLLDMPALRPVMQLRLRYSLRASDGTPVKGELDATIHRFGR